MHINTRIGAPGALFSALFCLTTPTFAAGVIELDASEEGLDGATASSNGVMVRPFSGSRSQTVHDRVQQALEAAGLTLVPVGFEAGVKLGQSPGPYVQVARESGIRAYVHGSIEVTKSGWTLTLEVRNGSTGTLFAEHRVQAAHLPGLLRAIDEQVYSLLQPGFRQTTTPASLMSTLSTASTSAVGAAEVELIPPDEEDSEVEASASASTAGSVDDGGASDDDSPSSRAAPLQLNVSAGGIIRGLSYTDAFLDTKRQELFPHGSPSLGIRVGAAWYPAAHGGGTGVLSNLGINGHFIRSLGGVTSAGEGKLPEAAPQTEFETVFQEIDLGIRARVPMGGWEIGFNLGWGRQQMGLAGDNGLVRLPYTDGTEEPYPGLIPDVDSTYYRYGADVGFPWLGWNWVLGLGMRTPDFSNEPGQIAHERWFPGVTATTATASLSVGIPLSDSFSLSLLADFRQTGMDMNASTSSIISDGYGNEPQLRNSIAGGATDRYTLLMAGITWSIGGGAADPSSGGDEADESGDYSEAESDAVDTSNPDFFSSGDTSTSTPAEDTSNPDFFE